MMPPPLCSCLCTCSKEVGEKLMALIEDLDSSAGHLKISESTIRICRIFLCYPTLVLQASHCCVKGAVADAFFDVIFVANRKFPACQAFCAQGSQQFQFSLRRQSHL